MMIDPMMAALRNRTKESVHCATSSVERFVDDKLKFTGGRSAITLTSSGFIFIGVESIFSHGKLTSLAEGWFVDVHCPCYKFRFCRWNFTNGTYDDVSLGGLAASASVVVGSIGIWNKTKWMLVLAFWWLIFFFVSVIESCTVLIMIERFLFEIETGNGFLNRTYKKFWWSS